MSVMGEGFEGKVALVTGGSSGIGAAVAVEFAARGARVVVADLVSAEEDAIVPEIREAGGEALYLRCDVTRSEDVAALFEQSVSEFGRIDCAFNSAGILGPVGPLVLSAEEEWQRVIDVNLTGLYRCLKSEIRQMLRNDGGAIVNAASVFGMVAIEGLSSYVAAKHGVIGLTRAAALETASRKVRINAICPGFVDTPMLRGSKLAGPSGSVDQIGERHPMKRVATPFEIARTVIWLCSDAASFITGHALAADGGYLAR